MKIGVLVPLTNRVEEEFAKVRNLGLGSCQLSGWEEGLFTPEMARRVRTASEETGVSVSAFWCGWEPPAVWDFVDGPVTLGLVPAAYRMNRTRTLLQGSDFAADFGAPDLVTHVGFIPEDPNHPDYRGTMAAVARVADRCRQNGQYFLFETGQETPVTLCRMIRDLGRPNLGVNLDPANLLLYGKANPVDALGLLGPYVRGVHAKDGAYPTEPHCLGEEKPLGQGGVDYPALIAGLKRWGYDGALTIEREISGEEQIRDILAAKTLLEGLL